MCTSVISPAGRKKKILDKTNYNNFYFFYFTSRNIVLLLFAKTNKNKPEKLIK